MTQANLANHYSKVGLLITHFNRAKSLERLLNSFKKLEVSFGEIVVSDDGSKAQHLEHLERLQESFDFKLIITSQNKGLGNNINKGQSKISLPYTLYVQEDFVPLTAFNENFAASLKVMDSDNSIDLIRYYAYFKHPYTKSYNNLLNEMLFSTSLLKLNHLKFYSYSDHPHLRRKSFCEKFKPYKEGVKGDITEFDMCLSFLKNKGRGLQMKNFNLMFDQVNSNEEPSTMIRTMWTQNENISVKALRAVYLRFRSLKNTVQYYRYKN